MPETKSKTLLDMATGVAQDAVEGLAHAVRTVKDRVQGENYSSKDGSHLAYLGEGVVKLMGELRQQEKHERAVADKLSESERLELVRAFLQDLPADQRRSLLADVSTEGKVL